MIRPIVTLVFLSAAGGPVPLDDALRSEEFLFGAEPVVAAASRREQPLHEAPFAVTVFEAEDIKMFGIRTISDLFRLVPGMDLSSMTPGFTYFNIRGFATEKNARTLVLMDGRIVNIEAIGTSLVEILPVSIDEIERIEVIRGGGSALYGPNAFSGIISIITKAPARTPAAWGMVSGGTQPDQMSVKPLGTASASAGSGHAWTGIMGYHVSAGYRQTNDWAVPDRINHRVRWGRVYLDTDALPGGTISLEAGGVSASSDLFASIANIPLDGQEYYGQLRGRYRGLDLNAYYKKFHSSGALATLVGGLLPLGVPLTGDTTTLSMDAQYEARAGDWGIFTPGVNVRRMNYAIGGFRKTYRGITLDQESTLGGFLHSEIFLPKRISAALDLRYDWFEITEAAFSPRLSVSWGITPSHIVRVAAGQSFRKPTWLEAQAISQDRLLVGLFKVPIGNPDARNELVRTVELGYRGYAGKGVKADATLFYAQYTNFLSLQASLVPPAKFRTENYSVMMWGAGGELEISYCPRAWVKTAASYSLLYRKEYFSGAVDRYPQNKGTLSVSLRPSGLPFVGVAAHYVGAFAYEITDPVTISNVKQWIRPYVLGTAVAGYGFLQGRLEAGVQFFNVFNASHRETGYLPAPVNIGAEEVGEKVLLFVRAGF